MNEDSKRTVLQYYGRKSRLNTYSSPLSYPKMHNACRYVLPHYTFSEPIHVAEVFLKSGRDTMLKCSLVPFLQEFDIHDFETWFYLNQMALWQYMNSE